jgi:hypothetical protein
MSAVLPFVGPLCSPLRQRLPPQSARCPALQALRLLPSTSANFDLGITQATIGSSSSGAGAGKVTFQPLVVNTSFAPFQSLFNAAVAARPFESCTLTTKNSTGEVIEFTLKPVAVKEVDAIAQSASADAARTAYRQVTFEYGGVQVTSPSSDTDDGGSSPANDGWVRVKDRPSN